MMLVTAKSILVGPLVSVVDVIDLGARYGIVGKCGC